MTRCTLWILGGCAAAVLQGCASTPQAALDEANNGAALATTLSAQVENFREQQRRVLEARLERVRQLRLKVARYEIDSAFDQRVQSAAGNTRNSALYDQLLQLADSRAADEEARAAAQKDVDSAMDHLLQPLPSVTKELAATQQALAKLGEELPLKDRLKITATFARSVYRTIQDNRAKIEQANQAAPDPTAVQTEASGAQQ